MTMIPTCPRATVEDALQTKNSASYRVVDWDSDGTADFITGDIYKYYEVKAVTSKTVRLGGFDGTHRVRSGSGRRDHRR